MLIPLRVYSNYSLLQSSISAKDAVDFCLKSKINSIGIANENNMFGYLQWCNEIKKNKIKPVIGTSLKVEQGFVWAYCKNKN